MSIELRPATPTDYPAILGLIKELAEFEHASEKVTNTVEQMNKEDDLFEAIVALDGDTIAGMALYFFAYYTWVGKSLYLDDLYIQPEYRSRGIGSRLMNEVFKVGKEQNCKRIRWQVLNWNQDAVNLYKKIGATIDDGWCNCDIENFTGGQE